jgi:hypothetical protein
MSLRSVRARLARLERRQRARAAGGPPPRFWNALCGAVPLDRLDPQTRRLVESLYGRDDQPDPIEERIAAAGRPGFPCGLVELPEPDITIGGGDDERERA